MMETTAAEWGSVTYDIYDAWPAYKGRKFKVYKKLKDAPGEYDCIVMMNLMPKRVKHRKMHRGSRSGNATSGTYVAFGDFGLQVLDRGWITNNQIEACRIAINRYLKRKGKVFIRIFPQKSFTSRPPDTRMGKGKGAVEGWVAVVRPGNILFEVGGVTESQAREALRLASNKLGVSTRFVYRQGVQH